MFSKKEMEIMSTWKYGSNEEPWIIIKMLTYNHEKYVAEAIEGCLSQISEYSFCLLIHDDASTDSTPQIITEYAKQYPKLIHTVLQVENQYSKKDGSIARILKPMVQSQYIAYCEGDDFWIDEFKLQKQIVFLMNNPDYVAVYANILPVDEESQYDESRRGMYKELNEGDYTEKEISLGVLKTQTATLLHRNVFNTMSEADFNYYVSCKANGDQKMLVLLSSYGKIHYLKDILAAHRKEYTAGTSWTAYYSSLSEAQKAKEAYNKNTSIADLYSHFHHKEMRIWEVMLFQRLEIRKKLGKTKNSEEYNLYKSILEDRRIYYHINWFLLSYMLIRRVFRKVAKTLARKK